MRKKKRGRKKERGGGGKNRMDLPISLFIYFEKGSSKKEEREESK